MKRSIVNEQNLKEIREQLMSRSPEAFEEQEKAVKEILAAVRKDGDEAVLDYTRRFDGVDLTPQTLAVSDEEIREAYEKADPALPEVIRKALVNIRSYHEKQKRNSWITTTEEGVMLGAQYRAMDRAGVYVPGGKAAYPSSVLMNIVDDALPQRRKHRSRRPGRGA